MYHDISCRYGKYEHSAEASSSPHVDILTSGHIVNSYFQYLHAMPCYICILSIRNKWGLCKKDAGNECAKTSRMNYCKFPSYFYYYITMSIRNCLFAYNLLRSH